MRARLTRLAIMLGGFVLLFGSWHVASMFFHPLLLPSPWLTLLTTANLFENGVLLQSMAISLERICAGWVLGSVIGIPLGLLMGFIPVVRKAATPYVQGLRYIPPIAFVGVFVVWFGTGEMSKIMLVFYTAFFVIVINTMAGALAVPPGLTRAARSLGAGEREILVHVILPCAVPYILTGLRMALGNAFIVIAAAEMLAATSGMGFLIWSARNQMLTDQIFVGFMVLGLMGLATDRLSRMVFKRLLPYHRIV